MGKKKSIVANFAFQLLYKLLVMLVPFVTAPYISRTLGLEGVGIFSYYNAITLFFVLFANLGMENYGAREIARIGIIDKKHLSEKFCNLLGIKMIIGSISLSVYLIYAIFFVKENQAVALIFSLYIASAMIDINWFYIGIEDFKLIALRNMAVKLIVTALIFIFIKSPNDLNLYTLIMVGGTYLLSQFIGWGFVIKNIKFTRPHLKEMLKMIKPLFVLFVPVLGLQLYRHMDKIMLGILSGTDQVGLYEYTEKIYMLCVSVVAVCGDVGMPRVVSYLAKGNEEASKKLIDQFVDFGICLAIGMTFGLSAISHHFIILFYGEEFSDCGDLLILLASTIVFLCVSIIVRKEYLIPYGKENIFVQASCIGVIINFILNMILIPNYAARGAIIATIITECFVMIYQFIRIGKALPIKKYCLHAIWFLIGGGIMWLVLHFIWGNQEGTWAIVILEVLVGIAVYAVFALAFIYKNYRDDVKMFLNKLRHKNVS